MIETKEVYDAMEDLAATWTKHGDVAMGQALYDAHETIEALRGVAKRAEWNVGQFSCPICAMGKSQGHADWCAYADLPDWITDA